MEKIYKDFREEINLDFGLDAIISQLQKLRTKSTKDGKCELDLEIDSGWANYTIFNWKRLETDKELQNRIDTIKLDKIKEEKSKELRRKEYLKLKKEFENETY